MLRLSLASLWNRRVTAALTVFAIALSVAMLLGVEKLRRDARESFANTISGTDLIVGARSGSVQLLLYSVFRIGDATNNVSMQSFEAISALPGVAWSVPLSLGDSHRGFRVLGTSVEYFERYRYAGQQRLRLAQGQVFADVFDTVLGAEVAERLGYSLGDSIVVTHGVSDVSLMAHEDKPFRVAGILERTGTPVDRTVHVSLEGIEAMHVDWHAGAPVPGHRTSADAVRAMQLRPKSVTAFLLGLDSKLAIFRVQRAINEYRSEPLLAIIPGVALQELWDLMAIAENALFIISVLVVVTGLCGMLTVILASLEARRREMAVLRSLGARPGYVFALFMSEAGLLTALGAALGLALLYVMSLMLQPLLLARFGLQIPLGAPLASDLLMLAGVVVAGIVVGTIPALRAYRLSLADGLVMRI
ncbi:MAG: ABC transporter permease [Gammaproteobacteria bacterium]|nr:ABC transporter permease [Gammaproteobacteria bacterium]